MINYLIKIIKLLEEINVRLDRLENKDKTIIGTRTNRLTRATGSTITIKNGGIR